MKGEKRGKQEGGQAKSRSQVQETAGSGFWVQRFKKLRFQVQRQELVPGSGFRGSRLKIKNGCRFPVSGSNLKNMNQISSFNLLTSEPLNLEPFSGFCRLIS
jgi:hypothetical protein